MRHSRARTPTRRRCCSCTAWAPPRCSTGRPRSSRSRRGSTWSRSISAVTAAARRPIASSGWPTAPTTLRPRPHATRGSTAVVLVGYSMGSQVAQLVWQRHPELMSGLVLCAASRNFKGKPGERLFFTALPAIVGAVQLMLPAPPAAVRQQADAFDADRGRPCVGYRDGRGRSSGVPGRRPCSRRSRPSAASARTTGSARSTCPPSVVVMIRDRGVPPTRADQARAVHPRRHHPSGRRGTCGVHVRLAALRARARGGVRVGRRPDRSHALGRLAGWTSPRSRR